MAAFAGFETGLLKGVMLEEAIKMYLIAPHSRIVVVAELAGGRVGDDGVEPAGKLDEQPRGLVLKEFRGAVDGLRQGEPPARSGDRIGIADFGLDADDVAQSGAPFGREQRAK